MTNEVANDEKYVIRFPKSSKGRRSRWGDISDKILCLKLAFLLLCLIAAAMVVLFADSTVELRTYLVRLAFQERSNKVKCVVIIDASATSSRLFAYNIKNINIDSTTLDFDEIFHEHSPGIFAFADDPAEGANSIRLLLDKAKAFIPKENWFYTPLILRVTAELRLLPQLTQSKVGDILNAVHDMFTKSEFRVDADAVKVMDETDRAIYTWSTINFLLKRFSEHNQMAVLDLRGDSMQVTFTPTFGAEKTIYASYMRKVNTFNRKFNVFTNSYFGLGLLAARQAVFTAGYDKKELNVESVCVNAIIKNRTWTYGNMEYKVSGKNNSRSVKWYPTVDFNACYELVRSKVQLMPKPFIPKPPLVLGLSNYFEVALEAGLIDPFVGGTILVNDYTLKARDMCSIPNDEQPFICFDLIYVSLLLREGIGAYGVYTKIKLIKKIDRREITWALGYAYNILFGDDKFHY